MNRLWRKIILLCCVLTLALAFAACSKDKPEQSKSADTGSQQTAPVAEPGPDISGTVLEIIESGGFVFVNLEHDGEKNWVAVPSVELKEGEKITLYSTSTFPSFYSKALQRTFENIIFAGGVKGKSPKGRMHTDAAPSPAGGHMAGNDAQMMVTEGDGSDSFADAVKAAGPQAMANMAGEVEMGSAKAVVAKETIKVDRAPGSNGYTVAELFAKAATLDGKKITINGKVVKVSGGIMGRNWVHIQDGSGDPAAQSHDLVVTSNEMAEMDKIITVEGVLRANKDFGSGYKYAVIIEDATFTEK